ncbi:MAG: hypothetical protein U1A77_16075 [Pirellulales bacterium]
MRFTGTDLAGALLVVALLASYNWGRQRVAGVIDEVSRAPHRFHDAPRIDKPPLPAPLGLHELAHELVESERFERATAEQVQQVEQLLAPSHRTTREANAKPRLVSDHRSR